MSKNGKTRRIKDIDDKIQKAQELVLRRKAKYEKALAELERLIAVRREQQQRVLMETFEKSERSFEDVIRFLNG